MLPSVLKLCCDPTAQFSAQTVQQLLLYRKINSEGIYGNTNKGLGYTYDDFSNDEGRLNFHMNEKEVGD